MSDVFAELDEVMRQEKLEKFWKENGKWIVAFVVMTILATAVISAYRGWDSHVKKEQTTAIFNALDEKDFPESFDIDALKLRPGTKALATLQAAGVYMDKKNKEEALKLYTRLAEDKATPADWRGLGTLMSARLKAETAQNPEDIAALYKDLESLTNNGKSPWRFHAHIDMAVLLANKEQKFGEARKQLAAVLEAQGLPETLTTRAEKLDHIYELEQNKVKSE